MAMQLCQVINSGSMTPLLVDTDLILNRFGSSPPPSWAPCWQITDQGDGIYFGVGWLPSPPYYGSNAMAELGINPVPPPPVLSQPSS